MSLVEVLVAMVILSVMVASFSKIFTQAVLVNHDAEMKMNAFWLASSIIEKSKAEGYAIDEPEDSICFSWGTVQVNKDTWVRIEQDNSNYVVQAKAMENQKLLPAGYTYSKYENLKIFVRVTDLFEKNTIVELISDIVQR